MSVQKQSARSPLTDSTVIAGPPERSRTRSPRWSGGAARICPAAFEEAASARPEPNKGALNEIPSFNANAIETRFIAATPFLLELTWESRFLHTIKLHFRNWFVLRNTFMMSVLAHSEVRRNAWFQAWPCEGPHPGPWQGLRKIEIFSEHE